MVKEDEDEYYQPPNEEDMYIPPGRKKYDRDELNPEEENIKLGPPTLLNENLYRQQFAIQDYMRTLREAICLDDVNSKQSPHKSIKPVIKNAFYIKE